MVDDEVFVGILNEEGLFEVEIIKLVEDIIILKIIYFVEEV